MIDAYFSATKIKWILDHVDARERLREKESFCSARWIRGCCGTLTKGKAHVTDYTNASRNAMFNICSLKWDGKPF